MFPFLEDEGAQRSVFTGTSLRDVFFITFPLKWPFLPFLAHCSASRSSCLWYLALVICMAFWDTEKCGRSACLTSDQNPGRYFITHLLIFRLRVPVSSSFYQKKRPEFFPSKLAALFPSRSNERRRLEGIESLIMYTVIKLFTCQFICLSISVHN